MIGIDKLPNDCGECPLHYDTACSCYEGEDYCNALLDKYGDMGKPLTPEQGDWWRQRPTDCPLILIERWRLESCKTCKNKEGSTCGGYDYLFNENITCPDWEPK